MYRATLQCTAGCHGAYALDEVLYRCPKCGELLEVVHDLDALRDRQAEEWKRLFDDRYKRTAWPYRVECVGQEGMGRSIRSRRKRGVDG